MNRDETKQILTILRINYPHSFKNFTYEESEMFLNLWAEAFKEDSVDLVIAAIKAIIYGDTREFAPNVGQVKAKMFDLMNQDEPTEQEAWNLVFKALCNSISNAEEEFQKLPKLIQSVVGSPSMLKSWAVMDINEVQTVVASNFMRGYKARANVEKQNQLLPYEIKNLIQAKRKLEIDSTVDKLVLGLKAN